MPSLETQDIERQIVERRQQLNRDLDALEYRVKSQFDWRLQFDRNPWLVMACAFSAGVALSSLLPRPRYAAHSSGFSGPWRGLRNALVAALGSQAANVLIEIVPGFREHHRSQSESH